MGEVARASGGQPTKQASSRDCGMNCSGQIELNQNKKIFAFVMKQHTEFTNKHKLL